MRNEWKTIPENTEHLESFPSDSSSGQRLKIYSSFLFCWLHHSSPYFLNRGMKGCRFDPLHTAIPPMAIEIQENRSRNPEHLELFPSDSSSDQRLKIYSSFLFCCLHPPSPYFLNRGNEGVQGGWEIRPPSHSDSTNGNRD
ncbi:hypothetical protein CDAR_491421 [Caerostris darwini]|uniref:Ycf15 n=1 Tax=Caerostris darwini TaxID=1538125 RepID=A0AAV4X702_9ARAC|nr:hypothetical protein CDAR_491421 [Caerostris darwini]